MTNANAFSTTTRFLATLALSAAVVPAGAALAQTKPALLLIHRNIQNSVDEQHWQNLNNALAAHGYRVLALAANPANSTETNAAMLTQLIHQENSAEKVVVISTAAESEVATRFAESQPDRVQSIAYISAEPSIATLGPRTVSEPTDLAGHVPSFQIRITGSKHTSNLYEHGASTYRVREQGKTTLANLDDLEQTIVTIARTKQSAAPVQVATNTAPQAGE